VTPEHGRQKDLPAIVGNLNFGLSNAEAITRPKWRQITTVPVEKVFFIAQK
jgi:hypothetical protein